MRNLMLVLAAAGLVAGCGGGGERADDGCRDFRIDSAAWRAPDASVTPTSGERPVRQRIARRIVACNALRGDGPADVERALGKPTLRSEEGWYWDLGYERAAGGLDNEQLLVMFDADRRVKGAEIVTF